MIILAWKIKELTELGEIGRQLFSEIRLCRDKIESEQNVTNQLRLIQQRLVTFIKGVTRHQRTAASHILVFIISSEDQRKKLPVQCVPYKGLSDCKVRVVANHIVSEMVKRKMNVAGIYCSVAIIVIPCTDLVGFTIDGEWNLLCTKENSRPLLVFQICADVRSKYNRISMN